MPDVTPARLPWPTDPRYLVGEDGTIVGPSGRVVRGRSNGKGYLQVAIHDGSRYRNVRVHKIVCETWHGPAPTPAHEVAHDDCDKSNNAPGNLSWKTYAENRDDIRRHHREGRYADHPTGNVPCKLTVDQVREARARYSAGEFYREIACEFGVTTGSLRRAVTGESYAWVD